MCTLQCREPAQVITDQTEENQEGTLCGFDKQNSASVDFGRSGSALRQGPLARIISALWNLTCPGSFAATKEEPMSMWWQILRARRKRQPPPELQRRNLQQTGADLWSSWARCRQAALAAPSLRRVIHLKAPCQNNPDLKHVIVIYSVLCTSCRHVSFWEQR